MGKQYSELSAEHISFIQQQKIFFVGTATAHSRVSVSPKGMDSFIVLNPNQVAWLNVTGSGNETSAHIQIDPRMTIMFCGFTEQPLILRLYGVAKVFHHYDQEWSQLIKLFKPLPGARQIFVVALDLIQNSCGFSMPYYAYQGERGTLNAWADKKGEVAIQEYWQQKNQTTIDGLATHVLKKPS